MKSGHDVNVFKFPHLNFNLVIKFLNNGHVENGEKLIFGLLNDAKLVSRLPT